jgi:hypothetical protein
MPISLPESGWQKFRRSTGLHDILAGVISAGGLFVAAGRFFVTDAPGWGWFTSGMGVLGLVVQGLKSRKLIQELQRDDSVHELQGCLQTLETILLGPDLDPERRAAAGLRLTIHVPDGRGSLVQVIGYVGDQRGGSGARRTIPENVGIIGHAYREAQLIPGKLEVLADRRTSNDYDEYIEQMVTDYGFTADTARKLNPATMSWLAIAIPGNANVEGVLYCDSKLPDFFSDARKEDILHATVGIAYFVGLRYS